MVHRITCKLASDFQRIFERTSLKLAISGVTVLNPTEEKQHALIEIAHLKSGSQHVRPWYQCSV